LRPIGAISFLPKLLDALLNDSVWGHLRSNSIISNKQFGFRRFHSTEAALHNITAGISEALDKRQTAVLLSIDVSKAFDSIDHPILLHKLEHYGFRGALLRFFEQYLSNRSICTRYAGILSSTLPIVNGVTQGSPLAGTLFILYEDDFFHLPLKSASTGFADDLNQVAVDASGERALSAIDTDLPVIYQWYKDNKLALNTSKTKFMILSNSTMTPLIPDELRKIGRVQEMKILGLTLNSKLIYSAHTKKVLAKLATTNAMILKLKLSGFPIKVLLAVYQALFVPHLLYCTSIWGYSVKALIQPIQIQQNKAIRIMFGLRPRDSTAAIMADNRLPRVNQYVNMSMTKFIFSQVIANGSHPSLRALFPGRGSSRAEAIPTRSQYARELYVPAFNTEQRRRTVFVKGVVEFNSLPGIVRCPSSLASFRKRLMKFTLTRSEQM
jgi:hypothetical protein